LPGNTIEHQKIVIGIKDFPTNEQAKEYFEKNKAVLLHSCVRELVLQYQAIKAEYLQVQATYKLKDFKDLFVIDCKACGFVLTEIGTSAYSITKGCCPHCDIDLKEARKIANASQRELPMFLGDTWKTEAAEEFYRKRMGELKQVA
jgi:phage FluMu protein Com